MSTSSGRKGFCDRCRHANNEHTSKSEAKCKKCRKVFEICQVGLHGEESSPGWRICFVPCLCGKEYYPDKANIARELEPHEYHLGHPGYRPLVYSNEGEGSGLFDDSQGEVGRDFEPVIQTPYEHTRSTSEGSIDPLALGSPARNVAYKHATKVFQGHTRSMSEHSEDPLLSPETHHQYAIDSVVNLAEDLSNTHIEEALPVANEPEIGWSEWEWNKTHRCNYRYRLIPGTNRYEYDYEKATTASASSSKHVASEYEICWSEWAWNETHKCYSRYRQIPGTDRYEFEYEQTTTALASSLKHEDGKGKKVAGKGKGKRK